MSALAVLLAVALAPQAEAGEVHGVVRSSEGGRPVAYANVEVVGRGVADWTDDAGRYELPGLPEGRWRIRVLHPNHDSLSFEVLVADGRALSLDVTLQARPGPAVDVLQDFEPFQVEYTLPALLNGDEVRALIQERFPPELERLGAAGETVLRLWLDERGQVVRGLVSRSSGYPALDSLAERLADRMRFRPAKNRDQAVRVIVLIPVIFTFPQVLPLASAPPPGGR